jgi:signal transduction histidine kinase
MPVDPTPMDLAALCRDLIREHRSANPGREIAFRTVGDVNGVWDTDRIRQAVSNLLGNAIQHGTADCPVTLSLRSEDSNVVMEVHNGGDPIPPGEMPKIFDPLIRGSSADNPASNRPGSIGMGLYIAREVAKSHGGRIDVASNIESGTSFTVHLPRESAPKVGQSILDADHIKSM